MKIKIVSNPYEYWYRKQGIYCFDFVNNERFASELNEEEVKKIKEHEDFYLKMYNASEMKVY